MKAFEMVNGAHRSVFHEPDFAEDLKGQYAANVRQVLALEVGQSVRFPGGVEWTRVPDDSPKTTAIICSRATRRAPCKYCGAPHTKLCDYPVERNGKPGTCDIRMCDRCATNGGHEIDYCRPHAKMVKGAGLADRVKVFER
jgi:hypothetical protein